MLRRLWPLLAALTVLLAMVPAIALAAPTITSLSIKEAAAYQCVTDAVNCVAGAGSGDVLYTIYYRINTSGGVSATDFASQYFICRIEDIATGAVLAQVNASNQLGTNGFPEGVCAMYFSVEPVDPVRATLVGTPTGFTIPPSVSETGIIYRSGAASFALNLAGNTTTSIAAQLAIGDSVADPGLVEAQPDGTIRLTDTGATYFLSVIPKALEIAPTIFQNFSDYPTGVNVEVPDNTYQTSLRALWAGTVIGQGFDGINGLIHAPSGSYWGSSIVVVLAMIFWAVWAMKRGIDPPMMALVAWVIMAFGGLLGMIQYIWPGLAAVGAAALLATQFFRLKV